MKAIRYLAIGLMIVTVLLALLPGAAYLIAIARVEGRPVPANPSDYSQDLIEAVWQECDEPLPIAVDAINPWKYALSFYDYDIYKRPVGERAAWRIASTYNLKHRAAPGNLWWHSSGAALSIWISRNWSAEQIGATLVRDSLCQRR